MASMASSSLLIRIRIVPPSFASLGAREHVKMRMPAFYSKYDDGGESDV
jgi:hypothetical protein